MAIKNVDITSDDGVNDRNLALRFSLGPSELKEIELSRENIISLCNALRHVDNYIYTFAELIRNRSSITLNIVGDADILWKKMFPLLALFCGGVVPRSSNQ